LSSKYLIAFSEECFVTGRNAETARRVLLSGSSGLIGSTLVRELAANRIQTIQLVRKKNEGHAGEVQAPQVLWDPQAPSPVADLPALEGADAAIHLSGSNLSSHRWTDSYKREIIQSRVQSTEALVRIFQQMKQPPKLLLCASATGIYGDRADEVLTEASTLGRGFLTETCVLWETAADTAEKLGMSVAHLRFGVVLSGKGGALKQMLPIFRLGVGGRLGSGKQWMSWIALPDLARAILHLLDKPDIEGPFNFVAPNPVTNEEFTRALASAVHRPAIVPAPAFALRLAFGEMADAALLSSTRALPERLLEAGFQFQYPEIGAALRAVL
jgi:uncharacterized protein